ncbi:MAG: response regulator [Planctomycetota bacterium]
MGAEPIKVLTVDDSNLSRRRFIAGPLRQAGYDVYEAADGHEGLAAFAEHQPDIVISDLLMPVMDGFDFVGQLKAQGATQPIIVASADIQETSKQKVEDLDTFGFLNKPFKPEELLALVQRAAESVSVGV